MFSTTACIIPDDSLSSLSSSFSEPSATPLMTASIPDAALTPKILERYCICLPSPQPCIFLLSSVMRSGSSRSLPVEVFALIPKSASALDTAFGSCASLNNAPRKAVPPSEPLMPALPITPSIADTSSIVIPNPEATGATYFIDSPSPVIHVLLAALV